ncbi:MULTISPECIES: signal peptidase II [Stenotrophomonas]|jgi:signal peptidase II|uniref:signal peptidase II n=1 Tax=Stenotrophomonas TaxID=40323 RepID=UPI0006215852|nr:MULTISPECIES: signal peptidase II [Stenotrophomonas]AWT14837.1 lipoprotein signal peptidase [Stenotrophomonas maltophilia]KKF87913.1 peptidase A8 [Stenotrophomonas maltophilia]MBA0258061.1 lipoprotein signal peptidase [Stenotrophomonas maltophilia]MBA0434334.1 lipoprotein signal peptidase [Stenotrophomonas maltophilia]MBA0454277.1 lipoprotein signal peptidase [Stenotrophomonas maltophilia]
MNTNRKNAAPIPNGLIWLTVSLLVIALDQASKHWVVTALPEYTAVPVIEGVWNWYRSYNTGAAFSFLSDAGGWQQVVFSILALGISGLLAYWLYQTPRSAYKVALPYALVIGGALSNVIDRSLRGHVVDFIQWHWRDYYWPAFNLSDSAIMVGAIAIALHGVLGSGRTSGNTTRS